MPSRRFLCALTVLCAFVALPVHAQKTEAGLLAAWAQEQRTDPATIKFEKADDKRYHFATRHFPFDGDLLVRNISIQDAGSPLLGQDFTSGTVEVELVGVKDDFYRTFAVSYNQWNMGNTLYWDAKKGSWVTSQERLRHFQDEFPLRGSFWTTVLAGGGPMLIFLLAIPMVILLYYVRYNRRIKDINARSARSLEISERAIQFSERAVQLSERNVQIQEEHTKLLQEIREQLKK
jgi:hypothetical protein